MHHFVVSCTEEEVGRERRGYVSALRRLGDVTVAPILRVTEDHLHCLDGSRIPITDETSLWFIDPPNTLTPEGLPSQRLRSVTIHLDSDCALPWRLIWSRPFSLTVLCCSNVKQDEIPRELSVLKLPYSARSEWFEERNFPREFQIGWIGSADGAIYTERRRLLPMIAERYRVNDWKMRCPEDQVIDLYRRSQVVINIQRDDFLLSYNVRCLEALAAGCLLLVRERSSLSNTGLIPGQHYETYASDEELFGKLDAYLSNPARLGKIADAGREYCRQHLTYDTHASEILKCLNSLPPANNFGAHEIREAYAHYFSKRLHPGRALRHVVALAVAGSRRTPSAILNLIKSIIRSLQAPRRRGA